MLMIVIEEGNILIEISVNSTSLLESKFSPKLGVKLLTIFKYEIQNNGLERIAIPYSLMDTNVESVEFSSEIFINNHRYRVVLDGIDFLSCCEQLSEIKITGSDRYFVHDNIVYEIMEPDEMEPDEMEPDEAGNKFARLLLFPRQHKTNGEITKDYCCPETVTDSDGEEYYVTEIRRSAFESSKLEKLNTGKVTKIGLNAFKYCFNLNEVTVPNIKKIIRRDYQDFNWDCYLINLNLPEAEEIGEMAVRSVCAKNINAPKVKKVGDFAFCEQPEMERMVFGGDIELGCRLMGIYETVRPDDVINYVKDNLNSIDSFEFDSFDDDNDLIFWIQKPYVTVVLEDSEGNGSANTVDWHIRK